MVALILRSGFTVNFTVKIIDVNYFTYSYIPEIHQVSNWLLLVYYTMILSRNLVLRQKTEASLELVLFVTLFMLQKFPNHFFNFLLEQIRVYTSKFIAVFSDFLDAI